MKIYFAGLARDCGPNVFDNLTHINYILNGLRQDLTVTYFLLENNSKDDTLSELIRFKHSSENVNIFNLDSLAYKLPSRIPRIAYCRNFLLKKICTQLDANTSHDDLLFWADLDDNILTSMNGEEVFAAIEFIRSNHEVNGVFPFSKPCYYDILALRAANWQESDCFDAMKRDIAAKGRFASYIDNISMKQLAYSALDISKPIEVKSAFGGAGLYRIGCASNNYYDQSMSLDELNADKNLKCEHVFFNSAISGLYILPFWTVQAPMSHVKVKLNPLSRLYFAFKCFARDILSFGSCLISD